MFASNYFAEAAKKCPEFLRHKTFMINPLVLKEHGFHVSKCLQSAGEFVVTKCAGYHSGFNLGFNCAESVNFAIKDWVNFGLSAKYCKCHKDNLILDMETFVVEDSNNPNNPIKRKSSKDPENFLNKKRNNSTYNDFKKEDVENWLCCDGCNKWRKIPKSKKKLIIDLNKKYNEHKKEFFCKSLNIDCKFPEEAWKNKYVTLNTKY